MCLAHGQAACERGALDDRGAVPLVPLSTQRLHEKGADGCEGPVLGELRKHLSHVELGRVRVEQVHQGVAVGLAK